MSNARETVAVSIVRALRAEGIERVFTLAGNQTISFLDAVASHLDVVHTRHEAAAVHMADAWGRITEAPGVAVVAAGPALANALPALLTAREAESPLLLISGQARRGEGGRSEFQQLRHAEVAAPFAKRSSVADDPATIHAHIRQALHMTVSGRPGPVHVSVPTDLFDSQTSGPAGVIDATGPPDGQTTLPVDAVGSITEFLGEAEHPLIIAGPAFTRPSTSDLLGDLRDATAVPIIAMESPRGLDDPSLGSVRRVLARADATLLLGKKLDWSLAHGDAGTFSEGSRFFQVDADESVLEATARLLPKSRLAGSLLALPQKVAALLIAGATKPAASPAWKSEVEAAVSQRPAWTNTESLGTGTAMHPAELCRALQPWIADATLVCDGGEFGQWAQSLLSAPQRMITGPAGAIGASIPFAVAAKIADPRRNVVAVLGDGSMGFHTLEFDTAIRYGVPFVAVVGNDARWNSEHLLHLRRHGPKNAGVYDLLPTRYDKVVTALGGHGENVTSVDQVGVAIERALKSGVPACVNVSISSVPAPTIDDFTND